MPFGYTEYTETFLFFSWVGWVEPEEFTPYAQMMGFTIVKAQRSDDKTHRFE